MQIYIIINSNIWFYYVYTIIVLIKMNNKKSGKELSYHCKWLVGELNEWISFKLSIDNYIREALKIWSYSNQRKYNFSCKTVKCIWSHVIISNNDVHWYSVASLTYRVILTITNHRPKLRNIIYIFK